MSCLILVKWLRMVEIRLAVVGFGVGEASGKGFDRQEEPLQHMVGPQSQPAAVACVQMLPVGFSA